MFWADVADDASDEDSDVVVEGGVDVFCHVHGFDEYSVDAGACV